ncbi:oligogalacturonate lyase family protein [Aeoliella sp. SH292]|uniref:oligogalacturonate lyase family protein n=1 Tax=Aeoliella sp. SH292 TaxID=3454464 RepID=UPI003F986CF4
MALGELFPSEATTFRDSHSGATVRRVTSHPSIHHHPFYYLPAYDDAMRRLYFVSHRTGTPQVFAELRENGKLVQMTDRPDLNEWSLHPSHDGRYIYYTAGAEACRTDTESLREEVLADWGATTIRERGMVGAAMGTTTVSRDDAWWALAVKQQDRASLIVINTLNGDQKTITEHESIGHPQFHPDDSGWLRFAGPHTERIWVIRRDGAREKLVYQRDVAAKEWVVHETWRPLSREILTVIWPHGVMGVDADTGHTRWISRFNAWHPMISRCGTMMITDTRNPDAGISLFDPREVDGTRQLICYPGASNKGDHWDTPHCPYDDGITNVYAPQHTHPHPQFSPDGRQIVYTSDSSGIAQVHEVELSLESRGGDQLVGAEAILAKSLNGESVCQG